MNRKLFTQIKNEWRDNLWLVVELVVVSAAIWTLSIYMLAILRPTFEEKGYDIEDVCVMSLKMIDKSSPEYSPEAEATVADDVRTLLKRVRRSGNVEAAALSNNALPYNFSFFGCVLHTVGESDSVPYNGNLRRASPSIVRVLRLESPDGEEAARLEEMLRRGEFLVSHNREYENVADIRKLLGHRACLQGDVQSHVVGGMVNSMKRNEYEGELPTILAAIDESNDADISEAGDIAVRVKPGRMDMLRKEFDSDREMRRMRNVYLSSIREMKDIRAHNQHSSDTTVRFMTTGIVFLLVIIFLGLLGTFWFRIRQRTGEIALRKTCGATSAQIFRRTVAEALCLLGVATVVAEGVDFLVLHFLIGDEMVPMGMNKWGVALGAVALTVIVMGIMIVAGVVIPARRAMRIEPAEALKEE